MAVPAYAAAGAGAVSLTQPFNVPYPASVGADDTLILHVMVEHTTVTPTTPAGWTLAFGPDNVDDGVTSKTWVYLKTADGTESGNLSLALSGTPTNGAVARMYRFTGSNGVTEGNVLTASNDSTVTTGPITTADVDRLIVSLVAIDRVVTIGAFTGTTGGTWVEAVAEYSTTTGEDFTLQLQTCDKAVAGTVSGGEVDPSAATAFNNRIFALQPTGGGGGGGGTAGKNRMLLGVG